MLRRRATAPRDALAIRDEATRVLRSSLLVTLENLPNPQNPIVVVTSPNASEGKTTIAAALARSLSAGGRRTVLVDLDLRHPDAHNALGRDGAVGASDVLRGEVRLEDALQHVTGPDRTSFYFLPAGGAVANPTELLGTARARPLLRSLATQADIVLVDSAPILPVADTLVIGRLSAGALLVLQSRTTSMPSAIRARDLLVRNQVRVLGAVVNRYEAGESEEGYGYGYGYGPRVADAAGDDAPAEPQDRP